MDQNAVVSEQTESGKRLIEALTAGGFDVRVAFWAKPTDDGKWYLYLASPYRDEQGPAKAYDFVFDIMRRIPDLWIDPFDVKVVGMNDSLTHAVLEVTRPTVTDNRFAARNTKPYPGMTPLGETVLAGVSIDGAYIYPLPQPAA
jgi:hypothetical protein